MSTTTTQLSAADLGLTVSRKPATPAAVPALIAGLRDAVTEWDNLANAERANGGAIRAAGGKATRYVNTLLKDHGADVTAVKTMVAERGILTATDAEVIAAILPDRYELDKDGELVAIDPDAKPKTTTAKAKATTAAKAAA